MKYSTPVLFVPGTFFIVKPTLFLSEILCESRNAHALYSSMRPVRGEIKGRLRVAEALAVGGLSGSQSEEIDPANAEAHVRPGFNNIPPFCGNLTQIANS